MSIYEKTADNSTSQRATLYLPSVSTLYSRAHSHHNQKFMWRPAPGRTFSLFVLRVHILYTNDLTSEEESVPEFQVKWAEMTTSFDSDVSPDAIDTISVEHVTSVSSDGGHASDTSLGPASPGPGANGKKMSVASSLSTSSDKILFNMTSGGHFIMVTQGC